MSVLLRPQWLMHGSDYVHDVDTIIDQCVNVGVHLLKDVWSAKWFRSRVAQAMKDTFAIHEEETEKMNMTSDFLSNRMQFFLSLSMQCDVKLFIDMDLNLLPIPGMTGCIAVNSLVVTVIRVINGCVTIYLLNRIST